VTFFQKILNIVSLTMILFLIIGEHDQLFAQLNSEQQNQIAQYNQFIKDYSTKNQFKIAAYYSNKRASVYLKAGNYQDAIDSYLESAAMNDKIKNETDNKKIYNNIAMIYSEMDQLKNTIKYFEKSLLISRRYNNKNDISVSLMDVATILIFNKEYDKALERLEEALKISNDLNDARLLRTCYNLMAQCYKAYGNKKKSDEYYNYFQVYDKHVKEEGTIGREKEAVINLTKEQKKSSILEDEKRLKDKELELLEKIKKFAEDSLNRAIRSKEDSISFFADKKKAADLQIEVLNKDKELNQRRENELKIKNQNQKLLIYGGGILSVFLVLLIFGAIIALQRRRKDNKELERRNLLIEKERDEKESKNLELNEANVHIQSQNKGIMQSINYAQRIQEAMLPKQLIMKSLIPESFIYFKPRDIVSGDFYWFDEMNKLKNGVKNPRLEKEDDTFRKIFIAAVDCTGHGVPGAFMSMLGFNLLNDIVRRGTTEADKILNGLHEGIRKSLNQGSTQNRDGMDMALCVIDPINKIMEYSGAQNPLIYIQEGKVYRVRGNKFPVGGFQFEDHSFSNNIINIDKPTTCYIFSDGFSDQFGGPEGRKFMAKNFRDLLFEIHQMPMEEQEKILDLVIHEWMGNREQTDDILVIGFKLDLRNNN